MIYIAFIVAVVAIIRLVTAIIGGISRASDLTYYLCRPFGNWLEMKMMWGFFVGLYCLAEQGAQSIISLPTFSFQTSNKIIMGNYDSDYDTDNGSGSYDRYEDDAY